MRLLSSVSMLAVLTAGAFSASGALAQTAINLNALQGLSPVSVLGNTAAGKSVLTANYSTTFTLQNGTDNQPLLLPFAQQEQKALRDAFITGGNADELSDALGSTLAKAYQSLTSYTSTNDGLTSSFTSISRSVANLIAYTYGIAGSDSNSGKYFFSNETTNGTVPVSAAAMTILTEAGGTTDVLGKAYGLPGGSPGADPFGDSRPFQTEPSVLPITGQDYWGIASSNTVYLKGPTQNLASSPSFPSGHTTYGYTESTLLAILVPQRFQEMITRGAEYGNDRIILGAHYTLDVIAGRTLAYYDLAQDLAENPTYVGQTEGGVTITNYQAALGAAQTDLTNALQTSCGASVAVCAAEDDGEFSNAVANKTFYESTQTYGLPVVYQNTANTVENVATTAPEAGYLLQTRFPYLTLAQRDDVLTSTEGPGGGFLDNGSAFGLFSRLDLYRAADGYGSFASNVDVTMNAALGGFNAADAWNNNITGPGGLALNGTGELALNGADSYSGATMVNGGTISINGSLISPVTVNNGGSLRGIGILNGSTTINAGGRLAPGNSPGTLTTTAPVTLYPGSISEFDIDGAATGTGAGNYSRIIVNGAAYHAAGILAPLLRGITGNASNNYTPTLGTQFQIVTATGGVAGAYNTLIQPTGLAAGTRLDTIYAPDSLTLAVTPASYDGFTATAGGTGNELAVATALDTGRPAAGLSSSPLYGALYALPAGGIIPSLDQLAPVAYGADLMAARAGLAETDDTINDQLSERRDGTAAPAAPIGHGGMLWATGLGQFLDTGSGQAAGYHGSLGGVAAGVDAPVMPNLRIGAAFGYVHQDIDVRNGSSVSGDTIQGSLYATLQQGIFFADAQGGLAGLEGKAKRTAFGDTMTGNFNGFGGGGSIRAGAVLNEAGIELQPSLGLTGISIGHDHLTESGGAAAVTAAGNSVGSLQTLASVRASASLPLAGMALTPSFSAGWAHEFLDTNAATDATFLSTGSSFQVITPSVGRDAAIIGIRAALATGTKFTVFAGYQGAFSGSNTANSVTGGLQYAW